MPSKSGNNGGGGHIYLKINVSTIYKKEKKTRGPRCMSEPCPFVVIVSSQAHSSMLGATFK